jgi:thiol-disulfide isomerase/thioredoxin
MKNIKTIIKLSLILLLCGVSIKTQAQYKIKLEVKGSKTDTLLLGYYYLGNTYAIDTSLNNKGKFEFKNKTKKLEDGIYFFTDNKGKICEFIIQGNANLTFTTDDNDWSNNMNVNDKQEKVYFDYLKQSNFYTNDFKKLREEKNKITNDEYLKRVEILKQKADSVKNNFIKNNPNHLLTKVLMCSKPIDEVEIKPIYKEDGTVDSLKMKIERFNYYKRHYFDNIDLSCGGLLRTPKSVFANNYNTFWDNLMKYEKVDTIIYYANNIIEKAKNNSLMYRYLINDITNRYLQDGVMGHDAVYVSMIDKYFKSGIATWMSPSDVEMNVKRADKWRNLLVGKQIPDLACPLIDTTTAWHHLDELKTKYKVLIFWSIECGHCTTEMPKMATFYNKNKDKYNMEIFAVHTEGDIKQRDDFVKKYNMNWINVNGLYANYDWRTYFDIEKTPIIYILDNNNKILAKNISAENIEQVMDILEKGGFIL